MIKSEFAFLGGGCFWCIEAVFQKTKGVIDVTPGYAGGKTTQPTYETVCSGESGHAEVVRIEYDPEIVSYDEILDIFWQAHDPTTLNRQGADSGTQYRSVILFANREQQKAAQRSLAKLIKSEKYKLPPVTEIIALDKFYEAEDYHRNYFAKNPQRPYCQIVIAPKLKKVLES